MNGPIFLAYIERCLAPTLGRRDIVIMDNLPAHKVAGVIEAIEALGVWSRSVGESSQTDPAFREGIVGQVLHGCATTTHAVRTAIQRSKAPLKELAAPRCWPEPQDSCQVA